MSALAPLPAPAAVSVSPPLAAVTQYENALHHHQQQQQQRQQPLSHLPSSNEAQALQLLLDQDMFTPEESNAWGDKTGA